MSLYKKILCGVLASAMLATTSITVFAAPTDNPGDIVPDGGGTAKGTVATPKISMDLPTLALKGSVLFDVFNQLGNGRQIISPDYEFVNYSVVPVTVNLKEYKVQTGSASAITGVTTKAAVTADANRNLLLWMNEAKKDANGKEYLKDTKDPTKLAYPEFTTSDKILGTILKSGDTATATALNKEFSRMARGSVGSDDGAGGITATKLDAGITMDRTKTSIRFDGFINQKATWDKDEVITISPVFTIVPQVLEQSDIDEEPTAPTITCAAPPTAVSLNSAAGGPIALTVANGGTLKSTLEAADISVVTKSADGSTTRTPAAAAFINVDPGANTISIKQKYTDVVAADVITVTLKSSAFTESTKYSNATATITVS